MMGHAIRAGARQRNQGRRAARAREQNRKRVALARRKQSAQEHEVAHVPGSEPVRAEAPTAAPGVASAGSEFAPASADAAGAAPAANPGAQIASRFVNELMYLRRSSVTEDGGEGGDEEIAERARERRARLRRRGVWRAAERFKILFTNRRERKLGLVKERSEGSFTRAMGVGSGDEPLPRCVANPEAPWRSCWDFFMGVLIIYSVVMVPYRIGFDVEPAPVSFWFDRLVDFFFFADLCVNFRTAYRDAAGTLVTRPRAIASQYLRGWFTIDLLATLPIDLVAEAVTGDSAPALRSLKLIRAIRLVRLLRLLRLFKLRRFYESLEEEIESINPILLKLGPLLFQILFIAHLISCFWHFIGNLEILAGDDSWITAFNLEDASVSHRYLTSMYWAISTVSSVGYGDIVAVTSIERVYAVFTMLVGASAFGFIIGNISSLVDTVDPRTAAYKRKMTEVAEYMRDRGLPKGLRVRLRAYYEHYLKWKSVFDEQSILSSLSATLRTRVVFEAHADLIRGLHFFRDTDRTVAAALVVQLKPLIVPARSALANAGDMGHEMFFLYQGFVEANFEPAEVSEAPGEAAAGNWGEAKGEDKVHKGLFNESPVAARGADGSGPGTPQHAAYGGGKDSSPLRENASEAQSHMAMDNTQVRSSHLLLGVFTKGSHFGEISLLRNEPRLMGFRSVAQCELFTLSKEDLDEFTLFNPEGHQELLRSAFRRTKAILRARRLALQTQNPPKEDNISFAQVVRSFRDSHFAVPPGDEQLDSDSDDEKAGAQAHQPADAAGTEECTVGPPPADEPGAGPGSHGSAGGSAVKGVGGSSVSDGGSSELHALDAVDEDGEDEDEEGEDDEDEGEDGEADAGNEQGRREAGKGDDEGGEEQAEEEKVGETAASTAGEDKSARPDSPTTTVSASSGAGARALAARDPDLMDSSGLGSLGPDLRRSPMRRSRSMRVAPVHPKNLFPGGDRRQARLEAYATSARRAEGQAARNRGSGSEVQAPPLLGEGEAAAVMASGALDEEQRPLSARTMPGPPSAAQGGPVRIEMPSAVGRRRGAQPAQAWRPPRARRASAAAEVTPRRRQASESTTSRRSSTLSAGRPHPVGHLLRMMTSSARSDSDDMSMEEEEAEVEMQLPAKLLLDGELARVEGEFREQLLDLMLNRPAGHPLNADRLLTLRKRTTERRKSQGPSPRPSPSSPSPETAPSPAGWGSSFLRMGGGGAGTAAEGSSPAANPGTRSVRSAYLSRWPWQYEECEETEDDVARRHIIPPMAPPKVKWDLVMAVLILYSTMVIPYRICFDVDAEGGFLVLDICVDLCFATDIAINFRTAFYEDGGMVLVTVPALIARHYLRTWFTIDVLSTLPIDWIVEWVGGGGSAFRSLKLIRALRLVRLLKLVRVLKLQRVAQGVEDAVAMSPALVRVLKLFFQVTFVAHLVSCFWYYVSVLSSDDGATGSWWQDAGLQNSSTGALYLSSMYFTITTFSTTGYGDITPHDQSTSELIFAIAIMLAGAAVFGYVVGAVASLVGRIDAAANRAKERMDEVNAYLREKRVSKGTRLRVRKHYDYVLERKSAFDEAGMLSELSEALRQELVEHLNRDIIHKLPFFDTSDPGFLSFAVSLMRPEFTMQGDDIFVEGQIGNEMYFLIRGVVHIVGPPAPGKKPRKKERDESRAGIGHMERSSTLRRGEELYGVVSQGNCFGEIAVLMSSKRTATARAAAPCYMYVLTRYDLHSMMSLYPSLARRVEMMIRVRIEQMRSKTMQMTAEHTGDIEQFYHEDQGPGGDGGSGAPGGSGGATSPPPAPAAALGRDGSQRSDLAPGAAAPPGSPGAPSPGPTPGSRSQWSSTASVKEGQRAEEAPPGHKTQGNRGRYAELAERVRRAQLERRAKKHAI